MLALFTSNLRVVTYSEFQKLFYQTLASQVDREIQIAGPLRSRWVENLQQCKSEMDELNIFCDLKLNDINLDLWMIDIAEALEAPSVAENLKSLVNIRSQEKRPTIASVFYRLAFDYAETLLKRGHAIIHNPVFAFKEIMTDSFRNKLSIRPEFSVSKKRELILQMEYFYFRDECGKTSMDETENKREFLRYMFCAVNSFHNILPQNEIQHFLLDSEQKHRH